MVERYEVDNNALLQDGDPGNSIGWILGGSYDNPYMVFMFAHYAYRF